VEQLTSELSSEKESHKGHLEQVEEAHRKEVRELKEAHAKMADILSRQAMKPRLDKDVVSPRVSIPVMPSGFPIKLGITFFYMIGGSYFTEKRKRD